MKSRHTRTPETPCRIPRAGSRTGQRCSTLPTYLGVLLALSCTLTAADSAHAQHPVTVLQPTVKTMRWDEAEQRIVAELKAAGFSPDLLSSKARDRAGMLMELSQLNTAGVLVMREGPRAEAHLWIGGEHTLTQRAGDLQAEVTPTGIALRVVERLNATVLRIAVPLPSQPAASPVSPEAPTVSSPATLWVTLGTVHAGKFWASQGGLGMGLRLLGPLSLELSADGLLNPLQVETKAGAVSLWGAGARGSLTVSWPLGEYVTLGGGVGAGFVQLAASASAARQFESRDDDTGIWLACARLRLGLRLGRLWTLRVQTDPTFFVPEVQIRADAASLVRLGRPWVPVSVGLAWTPGLP